MGHDRFKGGGVANRQTNQPYAFGGKKQQKVQYQTKEVKVEVETKDELEDLKAKYQELSGKKPHHLWKESTLKEKIAEIEG